MNNNLIRFIDDWVGFKAELSAENIIDNIVVYRLYINGIKKEDFYIQEFHGLHKYYLLYNPNQVYAYPETLEEAKWEILGQYLLQSEI